MSSKRKANGAAVEKDFPTHAIATLATGVVLGEWKQAHLAAQWLLGHLIWTHQFPALREEIQKAVSSQFPDMPTALSTDQRQHRQLFVSLLEDRFGKMLTVRRGSGMTEMSPFESKP